MNLNNNIMNELTKEKLNEYKENKEVLYIYKLPCSLYNSRFEYIIVGNVQKEDYNNVRYFKPEDWFYRIGSGSLLPTVCATLTKSGKVKEYVNIYQKPDIIKLRALLICSFNNSTQFNNKLTSQEILQESLWGSQVIKEFRVNRVDVFNTKLNMETAYKNFIDSSEPIYKMWREKNE